MSQNVKLITDLCGIIDRMNLIIQAQAMALAQHDALTMAEEIAAVRREYADAIGERGTKELEMPAENQIQAAYRRS